MQCEDGMGKPRILNRVGSVLHHPLLQQIFLQFKKKLDALQIC